MCDQAYNGNRAPILIANHFNKWNGDSFNPPAMDFMKEKCGQPDTYCATYQDVIAWMELQDPEVLAAAAGPGAGRRHRALIRASASTSGPRLDCDAGAASRFIALAVTARTRAHSA